MSTPDCDGEPLLSRGASEATLVSRSVEVEAGSLGAFLRAPYSSEEESTETSFLWNGRGAGTVLAGRGDTATVVAEGNERFRKVDEAVDVLFSDVDTDTTDGTPDGVRPRLFGGFSFHDAHEAAGVWSDFPSARFVLPRYQFASHGERHYLTVNGYGTDVDPDRLEDEAADVRASLARFEGNGTGKTPEILGVERTTRLPEWRQQVNEALRRIESGDIEKVVLSQSLNIRLGSRVDARWQALRLSEAYPDCYGFLFSPEGGPGFFGASPERLVSVEGREVETEATAGSIGRGECPDEDEELGSRLRNSEKDLHEHRLVAEDIVERLRPLSESVEAEETEMLRLENVQHLRTPVTARLRRTEDHTALSIAEALHPTPAVGGLPPEESLRTIRETEGFERGWYAAPVGWVDADGDGCFAVGIRSAVAEGSTVRPFAGAGIVGDSDPDDEWDEINLKYEPVLDLFGSEKGETVGAD